jgi:hypothetical protein
MTGMQDISCRDLQSIVLGACHRTAGPHLIAAGDPALPRRVLLEHSSYAATALLRIDPERLDVAFPERFTVAHHRGPARLGANHLDEVPQEADAPGAVKGTDHVGFLRVREAGYQVLVLSQNPDRQGKHMLEACGSGLDLTYLHLRHGLGVTAIHPAIMPQPAWRQDLARSSIAAPNLGIRKP